MATLDDKTKIPLIWAVTIVVSLASIIGEGFVGHYRIGVAEDHIKDILADAKAKETNDQVRELRLQRLEDGIVSIKETLKSIDENVERMSTEGSNLPTRRR